MEKALVIFSIVTHDHELMRWFWLFATLPAGLWHLWRFPSNKTLTQKQLVEISSRFTNIDSDYLVFSLLALTILVGLPLLVLAPAWDRWALQRFGIEFYPSITFFSAGYGIFQALFALLTGVYPM